MKRQRLIVLVVTLLLFAFGSVVHANQVTVDQARQIATNWVKLKIASTGRWGGAEDASVTNVIEFTRDNRLLGYYCTVEPYGFVLVSLYEGLAPTKAYSETDALNLDAADESTEVLRHQMASLLEVAEQSLGDLSMVSEEQLSNLVGYDHVSHWAMLDVEAAEFEANLSLLKSPSYFEGTALLSSCWNQSDPYNRMCPLANPQICDWDRCATGCVATAAAQIVRYWCWPPERDWMKMPDTLQAWDPPEQILATAELNSDIGIDLGLVYCNGDCGTSYSSNDGNGVEMFFQRWAYGDECTWSKRSDYNGYDWFLLIVEDLDRNRPIQYHMPLHQVVCDGYYWLPYPHYHMNWGHGGSNNAWYAVDTIPRPDPEWGVYWDYIIHRICPHGYLGPTVSGVYPYNPAYAWRYVDRECQAASAYFAAGNHIAFLPRMKMECTSGLMRFDGELSLHTRLFCAQLDRGILIEKGSIVVNPRGGIKFALSRE